MKALLALDLRGDCDGVVAKASRWATRLDAVLDLVYVSVYQDLPDLIADDELRGLVSVETEQKRTRDMARLETCLAVHPEHLRGEIHLLAGPPAQTIVELARDFDVLIVSTHGRSGMARLWMGSIAEEIVRRASGPVLVLRMG